MLCRKPDDNKKELGLIYAYVAGLNGLILVKFCNAVTPPPIEAYSEITAPCKSPNPKLEYGDVVPTCAVEKNAFNNNTNINISLYIII